MLQDIGFAHLEKALEVLALEDAKGLALRRKIIAYFVFAWKCLRTGLWPLEKENHQENR
jgi:hypothetical protein